MSNYYGIYEAIVNNTDSILIIFFIVLVVAAAILIPILSRAKKVNQQHERERQEKQMEHETQRQQQFLDVVKENSAVMSGVKALLKNMTEVQNSGFVRIHERLDEQSKLMSSVNTKIDATAENQREIASKLNKVWANSEKNK